MSIVTIEEFLLYGRDQFSSVNEAEATFALNAAESAVNEHCQRQFVVASTSSARSYTPACDGSDLLYIHDCTSVSSVSVNGSATTNYQSEPLNLISWSGEARPIERLRSTGGYWFFNRGIPTVTVTAAWGWAAIPSAVKQATLVIAKDIYQQRNTTAGIVGVSDFGPIRARLNPVALQLLAPYRRVESFGVA